MDAQDPFAFILVEAGEVPADQLAFILSTPFLNDTEPPPTPLPFSPSPMSPADDPILICSLPQTQPQSQAETNVPPLGEEEKIAEKPAPVDEPIPPVVRKPSASRRRSRGVRIGSHDSDEEKQPGPEPALATEAAAPGARILPATLEDPKDGKGKDTNGKKEKGKCPKMGSCGNNPTINAEKVVDEHSKVGSCCESGRRQRPMTLLDALELLRGSPPDTSLGDMDILEIAAMKGIHFAPPRWHRPGGYDRKPKDSR